MPAYTISRQTYRRKVLGCWLGKNVGGTLGQPHEGKPGPLSLTFYDPVPEGAIANDDLDLQLVWLAKLRQVGPKITERDLGQAWRDHLTYPWDEYGLCKANLFLGIEPPVSGQHNNWFTDSMGAPIRSEIWACVAPGNPDLAAALAYQDGCVDHGGQGLFGEIFFAALESAAFVIDDRDALLDLGLEFLPPDCRVYQGVVACRESHARGDDWLGCRQAIMDAVGHENFTDAPQNIAFTILGWLYGEDAGDAMCKAVNCGQDTDCTGATLGAILGLLHGPEYFDEKWTAPVGNEIKTMYGTIGCEIPATLDELTDWTCEAAEGMLDAYDSPVRIGDTDALSGLACEHLTGQGRVKGKLKNLDWKLVVENQGLRLVTDYGGDCTIAPGESITLTLTATGKLPADAALALETPDGWAIEPGASHREFGLLRRSFTLKQPAGANPQAVYFVDVALTGKDCDLRDRVAIAGKRSWRIAGPFPVEGDLADALDTALPGDGWRTVRTDGHALVLDPGMDHNRVYFVRTVLHNGFREPGRIVCATPQLQRVLLEGEEIIRKDEPTRFVPAPHRSGPGTVFEMPELPGRIPLTITLAVGAGARAELHCFLTERNDPQHINRNCPVVGVVGTDG